MMSFRGKAAGECLGVRTRARASAGRRLGCLSTICLCVAVVFLGVWALIPADSKPLAAIGLTVALATAIWITSGLWRLWRREDREIERFEQRPAVEGDEFLDAMGLDHSSEFAEIALAARAGLAELGCVPPESIRASDRFYPDLEKLPFYDSIDLLELLLTLEHELGVRMGRDGEAAIAEGVAKGTVADVVEHAVRVYRRQHGPQTG